MISAIVLAAGRSIRMGRPKMLLPWGNSTVIEKVITTLLNAGVTSIYIVTGRNSSELEDSLSQYPINFAFNPDYAQGEMLSSVKIGLRSIAEDSEAALIVLGDQPQVEVRVVNRILARYRSTRNTIVVPSYRMHRGHPWLVDKSLWKEILNLEPHTTLRDYLILNQDVISYVNVSTPSILQDLDTPDDYQQQKP